MHVQLRDVDELDSSGVRNLADKIASGKLSVTAAAECTEAFASDGCDVTKVAGTTLIAGVDRTSDLAFKQCVTLAGFLPCR